MDAQTAAAHTNAPAQIDAVVIGGSAGALDVLRKILPAVPADLPAPVVIVLHLPPRPPEGLSDLLSRECALPVRQAEDKEPLQPGIVYVAPAGYHLLIESHRAFALSIDEPVHFSRPSIDVLFESARDAFGARLLGMLLTGASPDGAAGLQEISLAGGMTVVQSPDSAEAAAMPAAALALFRPTYTWTPAQMQRELPLVFARACSSISRS